MTKQLFPDICMKTFSMNTFQVSRYVKSARVKQVLADLALSQVANRRVDTLTNSEHRRLTIGVQVIIQPKLI